MSRLCLICFYATFEPFHLQDIPTFANIIYSLKKNLHLMLTWCILGKKKVFEILIPKKINIVLKFTLKVHVYFSWHISKTFRFQCFSTWFSNAFYNHFHGPLPRSCPVNPVRSAPHLLGFSLHHYPPCCV